MIRKRMVAAALLSLSLLPVAAWAETPMTAAPAPAAPMATAAPAAPMATDKPMPAKKVKHHHMKKTVKPAAPMTETPMPAKPMADTPMK